MYKLFLTFRYLTRKKIVLFPILVVWLCVMMLIIVTSIMGGFVERVRDANRDLFGDIIISSGNSTRGWARYEELQRELAKKFPEIAVSTPVVSAYALIYIPQYGQTRPTLLVGVKPDERSQVTRFRESLYLQYRSPMQAVDDLSPRLPATKEQLINAAAAQYASAFKEYTDANDALFAKGIKGRAVSSPQPDFHWLWGLALLAVLIALLVIRAKRGRNPWGYFSAVVVFLFGMLVITLGTLWPILFPHDYKLAEDREKRAELALTQARQTQNYTAVLPTRQYKTPQDLISVLVPQNPSFDVPPNILADDTAPHEGCVVGSQIGFFTRDSRGNFLHPVTPGYQKVIMTVFPLNKKTGGINASRENAVQRSFTIIDDSHTGVYDIDSFNVYAPFETVQLLAGMTPDPALVKLDPTADFPSQCQELLIKLKDSSDPRAMTALRAKIATFVDNYQMDHPDMYPYLLDVQTWDEKQAKYLGAVENEKVMMTFILLLMSGVVIIVIFLIFYQIVRDKTRDIGIIKAVGGSEEGVAGIFLTYGLFVGIVGGGLGILSGVAFVTHTNQIHEWIYQTTGIIIWDRSVYLFDRIPDKVYSSDVIIYFTVALVAGILGALIPAIIAGSEDPVKAVRYE